MHRFGIFVHAWPRKNFSAPHGKLFPGLLFRSKRLRQWVVRMRRLQVLPTCWNETSRCFSANIWAHSLLIKPYTKSFSHVSRNRRVSDQWKLPRFRWKLDYCKSFINFGDDGTFFHLFYFIFIFYESLWGQLFFSWQILCFKSWSMTWLQMFREIFCHTGH